MATNSIEVTASGARNLLKRDAVAEGLQYLTFSLAGEEYGIDILKVQEIRGWAPVTKVPNAPAFVRGVMNLRGAIVPVIDLRLRFGLEAIEYTKTTVVIVVMVQGATGNRVIGAVVDGVSDVLNLQAADIQPAPDFRRPQLPFCSFQRCPATGWPSPPNSPRNEMRRSFAANISGPR